MHLNQICLREICVSIDRVCACVVWLVHAAAPELAIGSFHSVSTGENTRQVELYWQVRGTPTCMKYAYASV